MVKDKELDEFMKDELKKDITQEDSIDPSVDDRIQEMGWLFDASRKKLEGDKTCFKCKKDIDLKKERMQVLEANKVEKGVFAIVTICVKCFSELEKKVKEAKKK
jgi:hypothetical protein